MKKVLSLILVLAVCLGLCACSATNSISNEHKDSYEDVKRELIGTWEVTTKANFDSDKYDPETFSTFISYRFNSDGTFTAHSQLIHKTVGTVDSKTYTGTYTIQDGVIVLNSNDNDKLQYTYQNGKLSIYTDTYTLTKK